MSDLYMKESKAYPGAIFIGFSPEDVEGMDKYDCYNIPITMSDGITYSIDPDVLEWATEEAGKKYPQYSGSITDDMVGSAGLQRYFDEAFDIYVKKMGKPEIWKG